eukprot:TRINITY_DN38749_c0_g1_i1.p1 TRINITY_DN38749_c0_g1~~TRINITY_DN38749_c0_g1_i1.p1  ORF type:complete len:179 (-),score=43.90 TRINITY_DN38749_c0_g1_i1:89-625(-)
MGKKRKQRDEDGEGQGGGSSASAPQKSSREEREGNSKAGKDPRLKSLVKKFKLDDTAASRLGDVLSRWDEDKIHRYYKELRIVLEDEDRPSAKVMILMKKIAAGERLCEDMSDSDESLDWTNRKNARNIPAGKFQAQRGMGINGRIQARAMHEGANRLRQELQANLLKQMQKEREGKS